MNMNDVSMLEVDEQVFAVRLRLNELSFVHDGCRLRETTLWT
jgi:hypothetical protein